MLRFFRQLRHRLLTENKVSRYLLYAFGEIALVVIGILIALQVDNWNQQREQQQTVKRYLASLIEDINKDLDQYEHESGRIVFKYHSLQQVLVMLGEKPVQLQKNEHIKPFTEENELWSRPLPEGPDSLFMAVTFLWSIRDVHPVISKSTIGEMTSTGSFSFLENKALKDAINEYYNEIEWRFGGEQVSRSPETYDDWKNSLLKSGVLAQDLSAVEAPLDLLRNNTERIGLLREIIRNAWFRAESLDLLHGKARNLIQLVELELKN